MAIIDTYKNSTLGLKGNTPEPIIPAYKQVFKVDDPTPGAQGDEVYNVKSELDLDGKTPKVKVSATAASPNIVFDPTPGSQGNEVYNVNSRLDLDGKKPATYRENAPKEASF